MSYSLASTPLWLLTLLFYLLLLAAQGVGMYLRRRRRTRLHDGAIPGPGKDAAGEDAFAMNSVLGLLALLIGFTFSLALNRYDSRRELVVKEANALGTTWLRTDLLPPQERARMQDVLRRYVDARVSFGLARTSEEELVRYHQTELLQNELWSVMTSAIAGFHDTPRASLVVSTTNDSIDLAAERLATRQAHIPPRILRMLLLFALLAAALVGYERANQPKATALLLLLFALAVGLVIDLDRPSTGMTNVPQTPMLDLQRSLRQAPPAAAGQGALRLPLSAPAS
ncbi:MAG TPA: hypothetical protein VM687_17255 [Stenotrophomonas sp.]|nr:hypothetical protein [Stenotrophomonas sp.]